MKRSFIKRKIKSDTEKINEHFLRENQWTFFLSIWEERPHYSQISGIYLGKVPKTWMFDHLLEKGKYPELAFEKENIILCTFEEHEAKTMGNPLPRHKELINQAKEAFLHK